MCRRVHYAGLTVRGIGPDITAIRLSEEAPLLTNRHDNTKQIVKEFNMPVTTAWIELTPVEIAEIMMDAALNTIPIPGKSMGHCFQQTLIAKVLEKFKEKNVVLLL